MAFTRRLKSRPPTDSEGVRSRVSFEACRSEELPETKLCAAFSFWEVTQFLFPFRIILKLSLLEDISSHLWSQDSKEPSWIKSYWMESSKGCSRNFRSSDVPTTLFYLWDVYWGPRGAGTAHPGCLTSISPPCLAPIHPHCFSLFLQPWRACYLWLAAREIASVKSGEPWK